MRKIRKTPHGTLFQNTDPPFSKQTPTVIMSNITPQAQVQATQKTDKTCPILKEYLDAFAIEFLAIQGIHTANELLAHGSIPVLPPAGVNKRSKSKSKSSSNIDYNNASIDDPINVVRTTSLLGTDSHLTLTLYHYRFIEKRDPKPSSKLVTKEDKIKSCVQMLHRWVRKIKIVRGVPCSKGMKQMAESSSLLGLNANAEDNDLYLLGENPRAFLISEGIYTGEKLLVVKTGALGVKYKAWREKNGFKSLKSPGGASSISGWKNIIKTAKGIKKKPKGRKRRSSTASTAVIDAAATKQTKFSVDNHIVTPHSVSEIAAAAISTTTTAEDPDDPSTLAGMLQCPELLQQSHADATAVGEEFDIKKASSSLEDSDAFFFSGMQEKVFPDRYAHTKQENYVKNEEDHSNEMPFLSNEDESIFNQSINLEEEEVEWLPEEGIDVEASTMEDALVYLRVHGENSSPGGSGNADRPVTNVLEI